MNKLLLAVLVSSALVGCGGGSSDNSGSVATSDKPATQQPENSSDSIKYLSFQPRGTEKVTIMQYDSPLLVDETNYEKIANDFGFDIDAIKHYCHYYMVSNDDKSTTSACLYDEDKSEFYYSTTAFNKKIANRLVLGFKFVKNSPTQEPYLMLEYLTQTLNPLQLTAPKYEAGYYNKSENPDDNGFQYINFSDVNIHSNKVTSSESNDYLVNQSKFENMANSEKVTFKISGYDNAGLAKNEEITIEHMEMLKGFYRDIASKYYTLNQ